MRHSKIHKAWQWGAVFMALTLSLQSLSAAAKSAQKESQTSEPVVESEAVFIEDKKGLVATPTLYRAPYLVEYLVGPEAASLPKSFIEKLQSSPEKFSAYTMALGQRVIDIYKTGPYNWSEFGFVIAPMFATTAIPSGLLLGSVWYPLTDYGLQATYEGREITAAAAFSLAITTYAAVVYGGFKFAQSLVHKWGGPDKISIWDFIRNKGSFLQHVQEQNKTRTPLTPQPTQQELKELAIQSKLEFFEAYKKMRYRVDVMQKGLGVMKTGSNVMEKSSTKSGAVMKVDTVMKTDTAISQADFIEAYNDLSRFHPLVEASRRVYVNGYTLAHMAVLAQDLSMLETISAIKGRLNKADAYGRKPIDLAVELALPGVFEYLIKKQNKLQKYQSKSSIARRLQKKMVDLNSVITALENVELSPAQQKTARPTTSAKTQHMMDQVFYEIITHTFGGVPENYPINAADKNGNTALHIAVMAGNLRAVEQLLFLKPNIKLRNRDGVTFYMLLQMYSFSLNHLIDIAYEKDILGRTKEASALKGHMDSLFSDVNSSRVREIVSCQQLLSQKS